MKPSDKELILREIHAAVMAGAISKEDGIKLIRNFNQDKTIVNYVDLNTGENISEEEYHRRKDEFRLFGAL